MTLPHFRTNLSDAQFGLPDPVVTHQGIGETGIEYQIVGTMVQTLILRLEDGQSVYTNSGRQGWMSPNIELETHTGGGLGAMLKRMAGGSSLFVVEYTSRDDEGMVAFTANFPGRVIPVHLQEGQSIIIQRRRFLCAEPGVTQEIAVQTSLDTTLLGGLDLIMQKLTGPGVAFVCLDGDTLVYMLEFDQVLQVDPELLAMHDPTISFHVKTIGGLKNILFSGKKMYQILLKGPGRVFLQTMSIQRLAKTLVPHQPTSKPAYYNDSSPRKHRKHPPHRQKTSDEQQ